MRLSLAAKLCYLPGTAVSVSGHMPRQSLRVYSAQQHRRAARMAQLLQQGTKRLWADEADYLQSM